MVLPRDESGSRAHSSSSERAKATRARDLAKRPECAWAVQENFTARETRQTAAGADLCLPKSPSGRNALSRSVFSGYGRRRVDSPLDRLRDDEVAVPDAAGVGSREPGASATARGTHPDPRWPTSTPQRVGPSFLDDPLAGVGGLEGGPGDRGTRHCDPVASGRFQALLETEKPVRTPWAPRPGPRGCQPAGVGRSGRVPGGGRTPPSIRAGRGMTTGEGRGMPVRPGIHGDGVFGNHRAGSVVAVQRRFVGTARPRLGGGSYPADLSARPVFTMPISAFTMHRSGRSRCRSSRSR